MKRPLGYFPLLLVLAACSKPAPPPQIPAPVEVARVERKAMPERIDAVGSVEAINSVAVKSRVDGQLLEARVKDGDDVRKDQLLFKIDPRPAQATLAQVQAALAKDVAARDLALAQVNRYEPVAQKGFISADQMQQYRTAYSAAAASVKVDQANVEAAKLALGFTDIHAPFAGRAGRILVQPGNLVKANDTQPLLTINQLKPIFVNFALPGQLVGRVRGAQAQTPLDVSASGESLATAQSGKVEFVDNAVDPMTNTVKLRARFANEDEKLWPGQFVNVALTLGSDANALVIPATAIKDGPNGSYVFVVKGERAEQRNVAVARVLDGEAMISKGLDADEIVVTDGQSRVVDGGKVKVTTAASK